MSTHEQYMLKVTAGPSYDTSTHQDVPVNTEKPVTISSSHIDASIIVRVQDYRGLPKNSPLTSPYFTSGPHTADRYSIEFSFTPKSNIKGHDLVFGNDFEHPIRDRLPPLFDKALGIVKWWIDPGLDGDVMADKPYLYGALLSSINILRIGSKDEKALENTKEDEADTLTEGADGDGEAARKELAIPDAAHARQKFFLTEQHRKDFEFEKGREYKCDFFNPYLDFNEFSLKLGYGLPPISIMGHWDGQPLRYVLKDRSTNTELFVVTFQLLPTEEAKKQGVLDAEKEFEKDHAGKKAEKAEKEMHTGGEDDELD